MLHRPSSQKPCVPYIELRLYTHSHRYGLSKDVKYVCVTTYSTQRPNRGVHCMITVLEYELDALILHVYVYMLSTTTPSHTSLMLCVYTIPVVDPLVCCVYIAPVVDTFVCCMYIAPVVDPLVC